MTDPALSQLVSDRLAAGLAEVDQPCHACGHNLRGIRCVVCPECGTVVAAPVAGSAPSARPRPSPAWLVWWRWTTSGAAAVLIVLVILTYGTSRLRDRTLLAVAMLGLVAMAPHALVGARRLISGSRPSTAAEVVLGILATLALLVAAGVAV